MRSWHERSFINIWKGLYKKNIWICNQTPDNASRIRNFTEKVALFLFVFQRSKKSLGERLIYVWNNQLDLNYNF